MRISLLKQHRAKPQGQRPAPLPRLLVGGALLAVALLSGGCHPRAARDHASGDAAALPSAGARTGASVPGAMTPHGSPPSPAARERRWFLTLAEAETALGLHLRTPTVLPEGMYLLGVAWEASGPDASGDGHLITWYGNHDDRGVVFRLEQAAGRANPPCDPAIAPRGFTLLSGEGVCGGTLPAAGTGAGERWIGAPGAGATWRLVSSALAFDDLVRIGDGLRLLGAVPTPEAATPH